MDMTGDVGNNAQHNRMRLTEIIQAAAERVYQLLGSGLNESVYQKALVIEMMDLNLAKITDSRVLIQTEVPVPYTYKGSVVGHGRIDILITIGTSSLFVVEVKARKNQLNVSDQEQLLQYIAALMTDRKVHTGGMLILFTSNGIQTARTEHDRQPEDIVRQSALSMGRQEETTKEK